MKKDRSAKQVTDFGMDYEFFNHGHEERYKPKAKKADANNNWRKSASIVGKELILL